MRPVDRRSTPAQIPPMPRLLSSASMVSVLALTLAACVTSKTEEFDEERLVLLEQGTYAWVEEPATGPEGGREEKGDALTASARVELANVLEARGFREVAEEDAAVLMALRLDVTDEQREVDAYFAQDQLERYESGHLTLSVFVPVTYDLVWRGRSEGKLRTTAQGMGSLRIVWKDLDEARDWRMDKLATAVVDRLP